MLVGGAGRWLLGLRYARVPLRQRKLVVGGKDAALLAQAA